MAGKIWKYDCYDLRKFKSTDIKCFIDIGANIGSTTLQAKILFPFARIISFEPAKETFECFEKGLEIWRGNKIEKFNIALGDGDNMYFHKKGGERGGMNKFYSKKEREKGWGPKETYKIKSKTLKQIFIDYDININEPYILKIDCEGGERFLLQDKFKKDSLFYIRNSVQTVMEIHLGLGGTKEQWNSFINELKDTHELRIGDWKDKITEYKRYKYDFYEEIPYERGRIQIELINRKWAFNGY